MSDEARNKRDEGPSEQSAPNRWWEQYYVRYFVGTVVGIVILLILRQHALIHEDITSLFPEAEPKGWGLAALAAAGLAYCYIASAPILALHAIRGGLKLNKPSGGLLFSGFLGVFAGLPIAAWGIARSLNSATAFGWSLTLGVFGTQVGLILVAQRRRFNEINGFYDRLVVARLRDKEAGADYRDSYRHMREHGNVKSILLLEIFLGVILATAKDSSTFIAMVCVWLIPAAYVWLVASVLEAHFAAAKVGAIKNPHSDA